MSLSDVNASVPRFSSLLASNAKTSSSFPFLTFIKAKLGEVIIEGCPSAAVFLLKLVKAAHILQFHSYQIFMFWAYFKLKKLQKKHSSVLKLKIYFAFKLHRNECSNKSTKNSTKVFRSFSQEKL